MEKIQPETKIGLGTKLALTGIIAANVLAVSTVYYLDGVNMGYQNEIYDQGKCTKEEGKAFLQCVEDVTHKNVIPQVADLSNKIATGTVGADLLMAFAWQGTQIYKTSRRKGS